MGNLNNNVSAVSVIQILYTCYKAELQQPRSGKIYKCASKGMEVYSSSTATPGRVAFDDQCNFWVALK